MAIRKEVTGLFTGKEKDGKMDILIYLPANADGPVPLFVGLSFLRQSFDYKRSRYRHLENNGCEEVKRRELLITKQPRNPRGTSSSRWPLEMILKRGYGVATIYCGDLDPDFDDGFKNGVHPLFYQNKQTQPANDEWGTISAWAWGLSRSMDYF